MVRAVNRTGVALMVLALISACKSKPEPTAPIAHQAGPASPAAGDRWVLTAPLLDGYLRYQRALLVQAGKLKGLPFDGGLKQFVEPTVEQKATVDERARLEAGLTPEDVLQIEEMLSRVAGRRMTARLLSMDQPMPELPVMDASEPGQADVSKALEARANLKREVVELAEERAKFGNRNIDLLLQREDELLKNWSLMMEVPELSKGKR
jgi:hypothetical protein